MRSALFLMLCMYVGTVNLHGMYGMLLQTHLSLPACIVILNRYNDLGGFHCVFYSGTSSFLLFAYSALYLF